MKARIVKLSMFILTVCCFVKVSAQNPGFLGHRFGAIAGVSYCPNLFEVSNRDLNIEYDKNYPSLKFNLGLEFSIKPRLNVVLRGSYFPMQDMQMHLVTSRSSDNSSTYVVDTFSLRINQYSIGLNFRMYDDITHYKSYFAFGLTRNNFNLSVNTTTYRNYTSNGLVTVNEIEKSDPGYQNGANMGLFIGRGSKHIFRNRVTIDYGLNVWILFSKSASSDKILEKGNYRDHIGELLNHAAYRNSQDHQIFELYFNLGYLF